MAVRKPISRTTALARSLFDAPDPADETLAWISAENFKSVRQRQQLAVRPLTVLAGTNSSGKSSIVQPLLLLKQTLDATYDPGAVLLAGPNVKVRNARDLVYGASRSGVGDTERFSAGLGFASGRSVEFEFSTGGKKPVEVSRMSVRDPFRNPEEYTLRPRQPSVEIAQSMDETDVAFIEDRGLEGRWSVASERFFLVPQFEEDDSGRRRSIRFGFRGGLQELVDTTLADVMHLPGLRGNPERSYPRTTFGSSFPGQFQDYVASIVAIWQHERQNDLKWVSGHLERLGLTWKVQARDVDDTSVELQVGRLPHARQGGAHDLVNIADVGLGVSQILPVLVALRAARRNQLVLVEQPEIHLHPRAQVLLAEPFIEAANRGVRVILETHSALLIRAIQTHVARDSISHADVAMHWFTRDTNTGATNVDTADLDDSGTFGDWPIDFDDVALQTEGSFLDSVAARLATSR